jgi:hypothetical protein
VKVMSRLPGVSRNQARSLAVGVVGFGVLAQAERFRRA